MLAMLSERITQLLTAYVDGEQSARQRQLVERLLAHSAEARALAEKLQRDSAALRGMPVPKMEADLSGRILDLIAARNMKPTTVSATPRSLAPRLWAALAGAACLLAATGTGAWVAYRHGSALSSSPKVADAFRPATKDQRPLAPDAVAAAGAPKPAMPVTPAVPPVVPGASTVLPQERQPENKEITRANPAQPDSKESTELGLPASRREGKLERVNPDLPFNLALGELAEEAGRQRFLKELQKPGSFRTEILTRGNHAALDRLQAIFAQAGIRLVIDPEAQARLKNPRIKTDYLLVVEDLAPEELARCLAQLGTPNRKSRSRASDPPLETVLVNPMASSDRRALAGWLGFDPLQAPVQRQAAPLGVDIRKPLTAGTTKQVLRSLEGQGVPRPQAGKPIPAKPDRLALVIIYPPSASRSASSREVQDYQEHFRSKTQEGPATCLVLHGLDTPK
jgi:hypothetical protein